MSRKFQLLLGSLLPVSAILMVGDATATIGYVSRILHPECGSECGMVFMLAVWIGILVAVHFLYKLVVLKDKYDKLTSASRQDNGCRDGMFLSFILFANPMYIILCLVVSWLCCFYFSGYLFLRCIMFITAIAITVIASQYKVIKSIHADKVPGLCFFVQVVSYFLFVGSYVAVRQLYVQ